MIALKAADSEAYEVLVALIEDAFEYGLDMADNAGVLYEVPVGTKVDKQRNFSRKPMPWLGELKAEGVVKRRGKSVDYRLYFLETKHVRAGETDLILGSSLPIEGKGVAGDYVDDDQTEDMLDAMWKGIIWCEQRQPPRYWRTWD